MAFNEIIIEFVALAQVAIIIMIVIEFIKLFMSLGGEGAEAREKPFVDKWLDKKLTDQDRDVRKDATDAGDAQKPLIDELFDEIQRLRTERKEDIASEADAKKIEEIVKEAEGLAKKGDEAGAYRKLSEVFPYLQQLGELEKAAIQQDAVTRREDEDVKKHVEESLKKQIEIRGELEREKKELQEKRKHAVTKEEKEAIEHAIKQVEENLKRNETIIRGFDAFKELEKREERDLKPVAQGGKGEVAKRAQAFDLYPKITRSCSELYQKLKNTSPLKQQMMKGGKIPKELLTDFDELRNDIIAYKDRLASFPANDRRREIILRKLINLLKMIPAQHRQSKDIQLHDAIELMRKAEMKARKK
ncbi:hypothetical protein JXB11_01525 [Candidatus Woesearchaeota archaeon]|nr:hypothetical protein [Candidatus Woesearchaeota archaeon]